MLGAMKLRVALVVAALAVTPTIAQADDVPPPPTDCPPGSEGRTGHEGEACVATTCATDADCTKGKKCLEQALCVRVQTGTAGKRERPFTRTVATRACEPGKVPCMGDAKCESAKRCVDPDKRPPAPPTETSSSTAPPGPPPTKSRCGTSPGPAPAGVVLALAAAALAALVSRRRR